jgi:hypothetical protein
MSDQRTASWLSPPEMFRLDLACKPIREAFDHSPYLVGSVMERRDFRDVDVRLVLPDDEYETLACAVMLPFLNLAVSAYLRDATGLPVDFQIQQRTAANEQHSGLRNPLGLRRLIEFRGDVVRTTGGTDHGGA